MVQKKKTAKRKTDIQWYESSFLKQSNKTAREGKSVYVSPEFHDRLKRIVQVIGGDKITTYSYLHNILEQHFEEYADEITTLFSNRNKPIL